jgi:hypothetical protein
LNVALLPSGKGISIFCKSSEPRTADPEFSNSNVAAFAAAAAHAPVVYPDRNILLLAVTPRFTPFFCVISITREPVEAGYSHDRCASV